MYPSFSVSRRLRRYSNRMEFKDLYEKQKHTYKEVDIATEWNLKSISKPSSSVSGTVDIATEWNLKLMGGERKNLTIW